jgi:hypothetical protein
MTFAPCSTSPSSLRKGKLMWDTFCTSPRHGEAMLRLGGERSTSEQREEGG